PIVWIEDEMRELLQGKEFSVADVWKSELPTEEVEAPVVPKKRLPDDGKTTEILQAIVEHVLTDPEMQNNREVYGTPKDRTFSLVDREALGWPAKFVPKTHGHRLVVGPERPFENRRLGIVLERFEPGQKEAKSLSLHDAPIVVQVFNAGGIENGPV